MLPSWLDEYYTDNCRSAQGEEIQPSGRTALAEIGSLTVEFTRLTQLTGDPKYFDAVQRITDKLDLSQNTTKLPGLWPTFVDANSLQFDESDFTMGGCADSTYEYLPKEHILLGGQTDQYRQMYIKAFKSMKENLLYRVMTQEEDQHILFTSNVQIMRGGHLRNVHHFHDHLKCFLGGMVGIASRVFNRPEDLSIARGLTDGCIWAYDQSPTGIMPETMKLVPCEEMDNCPWDPKKWYNEVMGYSLTTREHIEKAEEVIEFEKISPGVISFRDPTYKLRFAPRHIPSLC